MLLSAPLWTSRAADINKAAAGVLSADDTPHLPKAVPRVGPIRRNAMGEIELIDPTKEAGSAPRRCASGTICVGRGQAYPSLAAAIAVARAGDVIEIVADTYYETARIATARLTLRGIDGRPHFDCSGIEPADDKSCLLLAADGITLDNLEISGAEIAASEGGNGACIRNEPNMSFTLRHVVCHESQAGILADGGTILVENSEFYDNGWTEHTNNASFNGRCSVVVRKSIFRDARVGHEFKSRCLKTIIADSTFRSTTGSRDLDIAGGGETVVYRSTLVKEPGTENHGILSFTSEACLYPGDMVLKEVRIVNSEPRAEMRNHDRCAGHPIVLDGVTIEGIAPKEYGYFTAPAHGAAFSALISDPALREAAQP